MTVTEQIRDRLAALAPEQIELIDESSKHAGHAGARDGGGHFRLRIVASAFTGLRIMQRHRLVYDALGPLMKREIHALSIEAFAPGER
jgi:BolA protein